MVPIGVTSRQMAGASRGLSALPIVTATFVQTIRDRTGHIVLSPSSPNQLILLTRPGVYRLYYRGTLDLTLAGFSLIGTKTFLTFNGTSSPADGTYFDIVNNVFVVTPFLPNVALEFESTVPNTTISLQLQTAFGVSIATLQGLLEVIRVRSLKK